MQCAPPPIEGDTGAGLRDSNAPWQVTASTATALREPASPLVSPLRIDPQVWRRGVVEARGRVHPCTWREPCARHLPESLTRQAAAPAVSFVLDPRERRLNFLQHQHLSGSSPEPGRLTRCRGRLARRAPTGSAPGETRCAPRQGKYSILVFRPLAGLRNSRKSSLLELCRSELVRRVHAVLASGAGRASRQLRSPAPVARIRVRRGPA